MIATNNAENLLLSIETRANTGGLTDARRGVDDLNKSVDQMSARSKAAFDAMNPAQQKAYLAFTQGGKAAKDYSDNVDHASGAVKGITDSTRQMTLKQVEAIAINEKLEARYKALATSTANVNVTTVAGTRNMGIWSALNAEATGHLGEHSLAVGRLERGLAGYVGRAAGANNITELFGASLLKFGIGSIETVGILGGVAAIVAIFEKLTEAERKTGEEATKAAEAIEKAAHSRALGIGASLQDQITALNKQIEADDRRIAALNKTAAGGTAPLTVGTGAPIGVEIGAVIAKRAADATKKELDRYAKDRADNIAQVQQLQIQAGIESQRTAEGDLGNLISHNNATKKQRTQFLADYKFYVAQLKAVQAGTAAPDNIVGRTALARASFLQERINTLEPVIHPKESRDTSAQRAAKAEETAADRSTRQIVERANVAGTAAARAAFAAYTQATEMEAKSTKEIRAMQDKFNDEYLASEYGRMGNLEALANLAAERQYRRDIAEIEAIAGHEDEKTALVEAAERRRNDARARNAEEERKRGEKGTADAAKTEKDKAARRDAIILRSFDQIVRAEGNMMQTLKRLAVEPLVTELEGIAKSEVVKALKDAASFNFVGAGLHSAAAIAAVTAAHEVASLGGGSSSGGGGSASGGGAGSGAGTDKGTFEPRNATQGAGTFNLTIITRNPYGRDEIQNTIFELNRAGIMNRPAVQLPPTSGVRILP